MPVHQNMILADNLIHSHLPAGIVLVDLTGGGTFYTHLFLTHYYALPEGKSVWWSIKAVSFTGSIMIFVLNI